MMPFHVGIITPGQTSLAPGWPGGCRSINCQASLMSGLLRVSACLLSAQPSPSAQTRGWLYTGSQDSLAPPDHYSFLALLRSASTTAPLSVPIDILRPLNFHTGATLLEAGTPVTNCPVIFQASMGTLSLWVE